MSTYDDELEAILREFQEDAPLQEKEIPAEEHAPEVKKTGSARVEQPEAGSRVSRTETEKREKPAVKKPKAPAAPAKAPAVKRTRKMPGIIAFVFVLVTLAVFAWVGLNIHPDSDTTTNAATLRNMDLMSKVNVFTNNAKSDALSDLTYIKKKYTIAETDLVAPKPDAAKFGSSADPDVIRGVIESAAVLLDGDSVAWNGSEELYPGSEIQYYLDDTIFVLCWKEVGDNNVRTCAEVKIADGSQLRRKIAGDSYGSGVQEYASDMAKETNAVVAINGDFYTFRNAGITAYQRQLYRTGLDDNLDSCFFTASGELLFTRTGQFATAAEAEQYMSDNDVTFVISFGPVLVDNGELKHIDTYRIGEVDVNYPRSAIGTLGERHYLLMTVNREGEWYGAANINQLAKYMHGKNCIKAYTLDGGQTAVIVFNGKVMNRVSYGYERTMSDIIYFATAIPPEE